MLWHPLAPPALLSIVLCTQSLVFHYLRAGDLDLSSQLYGFNIHALYQIHTTKPKAQSDNIWKVGLWEVIEL